MEATKEDIMEAIQDTTMRATQEAEEDSKRTIGVFIENEMKLVD